MKKDITSSVTKKEVQKCLEVKKIYINIVFFFILYAIFAGIGVVVMIFWRPTLGAIFTAIASIIGLYLTIYQIVRVVKLINGYKTMPCYLVKLDHVKNYLDGKIPVFAASVPTPSGVKFVETNAIYKKKDIIAMRNHKAKVLYDQNKDRIYIITLTE